MKVCVVRVGQLNTILQNIKPSLVEVDLVLFSHGVLPSISYEDEITGVTNHIKMLLKLSKTLKTVLMCCVSLQLFGDEKTSVIVCEEGKLLGICDHNKFEHSKEVKLFLTKLGSMVVMVEDELINKVHQNLLQKASVDFVVHMSKDLKLEKTNKALQDETLNLNVFSLNPNAFLHKNKVFSDVKLNFCEFFTKEFKI